MLVKIKEASKIALVLVTVGVLLNSWWNLRLFIQRTTATAENLRQTSQVTGAYVEDQLAAFRSPKNQKALEAGLQTGAFANSVLRGINTQILPEAKLVLVSLQDSADALTAELEAARDLTRNLDKSINVQLLPELQRLLAHAGLATDDIRLAILSGFDSGMLVLDDVRKLTASPEWQHLLVAAAEGTENLAQTTANIADASAMLPEIANDFARISKTSSRFSKVLILARILSLLVPLIP